MNKYPKTGKFCQAIVYLALYSYKIVLLTYRMFHINLKILLE